MKHTCTLDINAPPERVFDLIHDPEKHKLWLQGVEETRYLEPSDPVNRVGTKFKQRIRECGRVKEYDGEVTAFDPPRHLGIRLFSAQFSVVVDYRLTPLGHGTRLDYVADVSCGSWFFRMMVRVFSFFMRGFVRKQMLKLKELAEADPSMAA
jgi:carbon monoxide dehydrogenase subunit G